MHLTATEDSLYIEAEDVILSELPHQMYYLNFISFPKKNLVSKAGEGDVMEQDTLYLGAAFSAENPNDIRFVSTFNRSATGVKVGTGTKNDPYMIADGHTLTTRLNNSMSDGSNSNKEQKGVYYKLCQNINLQTDYLGADGGWVPFGMSTTTGKDAVAFQGDLDGAGYKIEVLNCKRSVDYAGLFRKIGRDAKIHNIEFAGVLLEGEKYIGAIAAESDGGKIENIKMYGSITGKGYMGGLVGSGNATFKNCYVSAYIAADEGSKGTHVGGYIGGGSVSADNFAGGMGGYIPTAIVSGCYNKGKISSPDCAGGLVARSVYYILINSSNLGEVYGSGLTAGILALGGNTGMINFCNNYGTISSNGLCAGIIAEAGDRQQLNNRDIASIIVDGGKTEYSILKALTSEPSSVSGIKAGISTATQILGVMRDVKDLIEVIATPAMAQDISKWGSLYDSDLPARNDALAAQMYKEVNASIPFYTGPLANAMNLPSLVYANGVDFTSTLIKANNDVFATNIHNRLSEISDQVAKVEKARKIKMAVGKCVLAVVGMIFTGGAATAVVATCSFALTVIEKNTERMDNSVEISQCSNFGAIKGGSKGYGLVAQLGDHVKMSNCFSAGNASGWGFADKSLKNSDDIKVRRMISIGNKDQEGFSNGETHRGQGLIRLSSKNENKHGGTTADRLSDKSTYTKLDSPFDFDNKTWAFLIPAVPVPYNNMYFSFR